MQQLLTIGGGLAVCALIAAPAQGAFQFDVTPIDVEALDLGEDGVWTQGEEWWPGPTEGSLNFAETWVGGFGSQVVLETSAVDATPRSPFGIDIGKDIDNNSGFTWTSYQVDIQVGPSTVVTDLTGLVNSQFADVTVNDLGGGAFSLLWEQGAGTGVSVGETAMIDFTITIDGQISFNISQTPIPTPASAALFGLAALAGARRRR